MTARHDDQPTLELRIFRTGDAAYGVELRLDEREFPRGAMTSEILLEDTSVDRGAHMFARFTADEPVRMAWNLAAAVAPRRRIRLRLDDLAPELHALPWEALTDPSPTATARFLAADRDTPFSRHVVTPWTPPGPLDAPPVKLLSAVANPSDLDAYKLPALDRDAEARCIADALAAAPPGRVLHTHLAGPCTLAALEAELERGYHVLHLVAHGGLQRGGDGVATFFEDADGRVDRVASDRFAAMLERLGSPLRLVVLMSCHSATRSPDDVRSGLAPQLLAAGIPAVLAMQDLVPVSTAHAFTTAFYRELLDSGEVDRAANRARATVLTARLNGDAIPVLYCAHASHRLWHPIRAPAAQQQPTAASPPSPAAPQTIAQPPAPAPPQPAPRVVTPVVPVSARPSAHTRPNSPGASERRAPSRGPRWQAFGGPYYDLTMARQYDDRLIAFAVDGDNVLFTCEEDEPGGKWGPRIKFCEDTVAARVIVDDRGRLCLFTLDTRGAAWCAVQKYRSDGWGTWTSLGGHWTAITPAVTRDNSLILFTLDKHRELHQIAQTGLDQGWGDWIDLELHADRISVARDPFGVLALFAVDGEKVHLTIERTHDWSPWDELGFEARMVAPFADNWGVTHLLAIGTDGVLLWTLRSSEGVWGTLENLGGSLLDFVTVNTEDGIEVLAIGECRGIWRIQLTSNGWGDWLRLGGDDLVRFAVARGADQALTLIAIDKDGMLHLLD